MTVELQTAEHHCDLPSCKFNKHHRFILSTLKHVIDLRRIPRVVGRGGPCVYSRTSM